MANDNKKLITDSSDQAAGGVKLGAVLSGIVKSSASVSSALEEF